MLNLYEIYRIDKHKPLVRHIIYCQTFGVAFDSVTCNNANIVPLTAMQLLYDLSVWYLTSIHLANSWIYITEITNTHMDSYESVMSCSTVFSWFYVLPVSYNHTSIEVSCTVKYKRYNCSYSKAFKTHQLAILWSIDIKLMLGWQHFRCCTLEAGEIRKFMWHDNSKNILHRFYNRPLLLTTMSHACNAKFRNKMFN